MLEVWKKTFLPLLNYAVKCCPVYSVNKVIIYQPIWPFPFIFLRTSYSRLNRASQRSFSQQVQLRNPKDFQRQTGDSISSKFWVYPRISARDAQIASAPFIAIRKQLYAGLLWMFKLLNLFPWLSPTILKRNPILALCINHIILSVSNKRA